MYFLQGNVIDCLKTLPDQSIHCCITSPPYWNLRDYGINGQIGLESTPDEYVSKSGLLFSTPLKGESYEFQLEVI